MALVWIRRAIIPLALALGAASLDILVDDTDSAISYSPPTQWSEGTQCTSCTIHPDPSFAKDGTWHDSSSLSPDSTRSITFSFTGTAVSVYNILPGIDPSAPTTHVDLTFTLDGNSGDPFQFTPLDDSLQYQQLVFTASSLRNTSHTLVIQTRNGVESVVLFDYIVYTIPDPPPPITTTSTTTISSVSRSLSASSQSSRSSSSSTSSTPSPSPISLSQSSVSSTTSSNSVSQSISSTSSFSAVIRTSQSVSSQSTGFASSVSSSTGAPNNPSDPVVQPQNVSTGSSVPKGALIGGAVGGGVLLLILLVALLYLLCKRRARRLLMRGSSVYAEPGEKLLPSRPALSTSSSVLVIGGLHPDSPVSAWSSSERDRTSASAVATAPLSTYPPPPALVQETTEEKPAILFADEDNTRRRLTLSATEPHAQESPAPPVADTRVLERLSAMQEEIARIRAHQAQTSALFTGGVEAPPSYDAA
ncbi:hypothetical protein TRAPUB_4814 [Trametes pubescens]|uniref:Uncharacterized protein n=1 Tax=Trametes pubescens TaxID=154538 RepID=A0A1M2VAB6_TRAPU|nr:hypothetical protein TRAPUB_4814 [Trametes pubescens]